MKLTVDATAVPVIGKRRRGRKPTLPKMNNSERGKYYRQKYREYEARLVETVEALRDQVQALDAHREQLLEASCRHVRLEHSFLAALCQYFESILHQPLSRHDLLRWKQAFTSRNDAAGHTMLRVMQQWEQTLPFHTFLCFELGTFRILDDGNVVQAQGTLYSLFSAQTFRHLCPHVPPEDRLFRRLVGTQFAYPTATQFHLHPDGSLASMDIQTEYTHGLWSAVGDLPLALWLTDCILHHKHHQNHHHHSKPRPSHRDHRSSSPSPPLLPRLSTAIAAAAAATALAPFDADEDSLRLAYML